MTELTDWLRMRSVNESADGRHGTAQKLIDAADEIERLAAIVDTICSGARWCGFVTHAVSVNVTLWDLPRCDGRNGTLLEAAEKVRGQ